MAENRDAIATQIQEGREELQRGDLIDAEQVRTDMQKFKADWTERHR